MKENCWHSTEMMIRSYHVCRLISRADFRVGNYQRTKRFDGGFKCQGAGHSLVCSAMHVRGGECVVGELVIARESHI